MYVAAGDRRDRSPASEGRPNAFHLVLLVQNATGYRNLSRLVTLAHLEGFYYHPRVDLEALRKLQAGQAIGSALEVGSPIDGVVMEQMQAPGQRVEVAAPLFKVARLSPLWLEIQVPLSQVGALQPGSPVRVQSPLSPNSLPGGAPAGGVPAGIGGTAPQSGEKRDSDSLREIPLNNEK